MKILAIETSCDETAVAVLDAEKTENDARFCIEGNALYSQAQKHATYGGVYPSLAKREHAANLAPLLVSALQEAKLDIAEEQTIFSEEQKRFLSELLSREEGLYNAFIVALGKIKKPDIDAIAVTQGPGLEPALWVGINFARALAYLWDLPILPVNHLEGHMIASSVELASKERQIFVMKNTPFPALGLIISGGHTELVYTEKWGDYKIIGATRDDSLGEAFDKVARLLGIPYPGGPELSRLAEQGRGILLTRPTHATKESITFPRPMIHSGDLDFSFSGLKTAVLYQAQEKGELTEMQKKLFAAEFEEAVGEVIVKKVSSALSEYPAKTLILGGGVSANTYIRSRLEQLCAQEDVDYILRLPAQGLSTDNAVMIGMAGYFMYLRNTPTLSATDELTAQGNMSITSHNKIQKEKTVEKDPTV